MLRTVMTPDTAIAKRRGGWGRCRNGISPISTPARDSPELQRDLAEACPEGHRLSRALREPSPRAYPAAELGARDRGNTRNFRKSSAGIISYAELLRAGNVVDPAIAQFFQNDA